MKRIAVLFYLLFIHISLLFSASVAVLHSASDDMASVSTLAKKLGTIADVTVHPIRSTYDISKVFSRKPGLILLASDSTIAVYNRFAPKMPDSIALFLLSSYDYYSKVKHEFPSALFGIETVGSRNQFRALSRFTGDIYPMAGFLYEPNRKNEILFEMNKLRMAGITPVSVELSDSASSSAVKRAIHGLVERGVTIVQFAVSDSVYRLLESDPSLVAIINQSFSTVMSERSTLFQTLEDTPILTITRDRDHYGSLVALAAAYRLNSKKLLQNFAFSANSLKLHYGTVRSEQLHGAAEQTENLSRFLQSMEGSPSDTMWNSLEAALYAEVDTNIGIPAEKFRTVTGAGSVLDRAVIFSITIRDIMIAVAVIILLGIFIDILKRLVNRFWGARPLALLYPSHVGTVEIERSNRWPIRLKRLLKKEQYLCKSVTSLMQYRTILSKETAGVHFVEWTEGSDVIMYLQHIFDKRDEKRTEPVVIFNIPRKYQIELFPRFSKTPLHLYETVPSYDDLERVFYGSGHQELHVSSIAGSLAEESLAQLLPVLENNRVSGALLIEDPEPFAVIFYRKGVIVNAHDRYGSAVDEAIFQSLNKQDGTFRFEKNRHAPSESVHLLSMDVLLNWSGQQAE